ncbi:MAG: hypothetical protein KAS12_06930, partial [Candidatus Aenigmarchaeota archaeon]|nr:hypothetical protein [Candidatus Aenigmarchaeota archaeon]
LHEASTTSSCELALEFYWVALDSSRIDGFGTFSWMLSSSNHWDWSRHESHAPPEKAAQLNEVLSLRLALSHKEREKKKVEREKLKLQREKDKALKNKQQKLL